jgi:uncharacterized FlaG/YvyC family protein
MNVASIGYSDYAARTPTAAKTVPAWQQAAGQRQLAQAARVVNQSGILGRNQIVFSVDSQTRQRVVLIEDKETHDIVQQIPPEYVLELAQNLGPYSETKPK